MKKFGLFSGILFILIVLAGLVSMGNGGVVNSIAVPVCPDPEFYYLYHYALNGAPYCTGTDGDLLQPRLWRIATHQKYYTWNGAECVLHTRFISITQWEPGPPYIFKDVAICRVVKSNVTFGMLGEKTSACTFAVNFGAGFEPIKTADQSREFVKLVEQHDVTVQDGTVVPMMSLCSLDLWGAFWPTNITAYKAYDASNGEPVGRLVKGSWDNDFWAWTGIH